MKFTFTAEDTGLEPDEIASTITMQIEADRWAAVFPFWLQFLRGAGFSVDSETRMYLPGKSVEKFHKEAGVPESGYLLYDSDLKNQYT